jgi:hypothetical protein
MGYDSMSPQILSLRVWIGRGFLQHVPARITNSIQVHVHECTKPPSRGQPEMDECLYVRPLRICGINLGRYSVLVPSVHVHAGEQLRVQWFH